MCFKERNTAVENAFHTLNCHIFGRHSIVYYFDGLYSQNIKICSVQDNASLSFAAIKSLRPDMDYLGGCYGIIHRLSLNNFLSFFTKHMCRVI